MEKKLYRIEEGKMLCGVCGGVAEYFNLDPTVVRVDLGCAQLLRLCGCDRLYCCGLCHAG